MPKGKSSLMTLSPESMIRTFAASAAVAAAVLTAPVASADPAAGTSCTDPLKIVSTSSGALVCAITGTGPPSSEWKPFNQNLETVVRGSTCGPDGTNGDFRYAQSTDNYLVWCIRPSYEQFPTWNFAKP
jgi:hypothetical protein